MVSGFHLYLISLAIMFMWFFCPLFVLKPGFVHVHKHLDRVLVSLVKMAAEWSDWPKRTLVLLEMTEIPVEGCTERNKGSAGMRWCPQHLRLRWRWTSEDRVGPGGPGGRDAPVGWMLVQLSELPVHRVDVHVVVLLKVLGQQLHGVVTSVQASLALEDLLHLHDQSGANLLTRFHPPSQRSLLPGRRALL